MIWFWRIKQLIIYSLIYMLFKLCLVTNSKLHSIKYHLYKQSASCRGRYLSRNSVQIDLLNTIWLEQMSVPSSAAELMHIIFAIQRYHTAFFALQHYSSPYEHFRGSQSKSWQMHNMYVVKSQVWRNWMGSIELQAFHKCWAACLARAHHAPCDLINRVCVYVDASQSHWARIFTQISHPDIHLDHADSWHELLPFISIQFD